MCSPFGPFWSLNTLIFGQKFPIQTAHHTFLESRHTEVTKHLYYVLFSRQSQILIFLGSSSWTIYSVPKTRHSSCTALFLTPTTNNITSGKMEIEIKPASEHSKTPFFVNIKNISSKEVNLSTKGDRHILKGQSKNENLFKRLL